MDDLSTKIVSDTIENIVRKKNQDKQLSHKLTLWFNALVEGSEDIDNKEDVWDRLDVILNEIEVNDGD